MQKPEWANSSTLTRARGPPRQHPGRVALPAALLVGQGPSSRACPSAPRLHHRSGVHLSFLLTAHCHSGETPSATRFPPAPSSSSSLRRRGYAPLGTAAGAHPAAAPPGEQRRG